MNIDLTNTELFKSFAEIVIEDIYVDLHNEFDCYSINYSKSQLSLSFKANKYNSRKIQHVEIVFKNALIELMNFKIENDKGDSTNTIDNIYRGRFEIETNDLAEISDERKYYYYINFCNDYSIEVFSDLVTAELNEVLL